MGYEFVGRETELAQLLDRVDEVAARGGGIAMTLRGRRQVGKSRLVQELCNRAGLPYLYLTAQKGVSTGESIDLFNGDIRDSSLHAAAGSPDFPAAENWVGLLRGIDDLIDAEPVIVVFDEVPWLVEQDETFDGALQLVWDRHLSRKPVLLFLLGSDIHMMERLTAYDRPFYGRSDNMVLQPFNPAATAASVGLDGADAIEAHLVSGGLPGIVQRWPHGTPPLDHLRRESANPSAPVFSVPESALLAEFPAPDTKRRVLEAIGSGDRTQANIGASAGGIASGTLTPVLELLGNQKRVVSREAPLSTKPGKPSLFHVSDPNLRWYLAMGRQAHEFARRAQSVQAWRTIERRWSSWLGRAVEPLVREALVATAAIDRLPWEGVEAVGGWWNRNFNPEIDLVGADRQPVARKVVFTGSIKWLQGSFDRRDMAELERSAPAVPGFDPDATGLVVVSKSGLDSKIDRERLGLVWGPQEVLAAWRS